eukprot:31029-Pelagococcus_subviridis.AAC.4
MRVRYDIRAYCMCVCDDTVRFTTSVVSRARASFLFSRRPPAASAIPPTPSNVCLSRHPVAALYTKSPKVRVVVESENAIDFGAVRPAEPSPPRASSSLSLLSFVYTSPPPRRAAPRRASRRRDGRRHALRPVDVALQHPLREVPAPESPRRRQTLRRRRRRRRGDRRLRLGLVLPRRRANERLRGLLHRGRTIRRRRRRVRRGKPRQAAPRLRLGDVALRPRARKLVQRRAAVVLPPAVTADDVHPSLVALHRERGRQLRDVPELGGVRAHRRHVRMRRHVVVMPHRMVMMMMMMMRLAVVAAPRDVTMRVGPAVRVVVLAVAVARRESAVVVVVLGHRRPPLANDGEFSRRRRSRAPLLEAHLLRRRRRRRRALFPLLFPLPALRGRVLPELALAAGDGAVGEAAAAVRPTGARGGAGIDAAARHARLRHGAVAALEGASQRVRAGCDAHERRVLR